MKYTTTICKSIRKETSLPSLGSRSCRSPDIGSLTTATYPSLGLLSENKISLAAKPGLPLAEINYLTSCFNFFRPHAWPEVASFSRSSCRSSKLEYHLEYIHYYLVTTIPTVGSGGNSRRDNQTPPSRYESQIDTPANHFSPRLASCSFSDCYLSN